MFRDRQLVIATKHRKEEVIAPVLERELGVICVCPVDFDTDVLGTFSGEVERKSDPISTAREKCIMAMESTGCDLAVASEGSFGPHPSIYFVNADDEFLLFLDRKNKLEVIVRELSVETNFNGAYVGNERELNEFALKAGFPEHGLILRPSKTSFTEIHKGIVDKEKLIDLYMSLDSKYDRIYIETDMRAMYNPKRMKVIERAAQKLAQQLRSTCPQCETPGFGVTQNTKGLPCALCGTPTNSTLSDIYSCNSCGFSKEEKYPRGKYAEDPMYCNSCNP